MYIYIVIKQRNQTKHIDDDQIKIIQHCQKSFSFHENANWTKKLLTVCLIFENGVFLLLKLVKSLFVFSY